MYKLSISLLLLFPLVAWDQVTNKSVPHGQLQDVIHRLKVGVGLVIVSVETQYSQELVPISPSDQIIGTSELAINSVGVNTIMSLITLHSHTHW